MGNAHPRWEGNNPVYPDTTPITAANDKIKVELEPLNRGIQTLRDIAAN